MRCRATRLARCASELAALSLEDAAPEELVLFPEVEEEFHRDPEALLRAQGRDEAVGFGLDVAMLTPYALAVVVPVIQFLASVVQDAAKEEVRTSVSDAIRRLFKRGPEVDADGAADDAAAGRAAPRRRSRSRPTRRAPCGRPRSTRRAGSASTRRAPACWPTRSSAGSWWGRGERRGRTPGRTSSRIRRPRRRASSSSSRR